MMLFFAIAFAVALEREAREGGDLSNVSAAQLADMLVSPNPAPAIQPGADRTPRLPVGYDRRAQAKVYSAVDEILKRDASIIPELIRHLNDTRYCLTEEGISSWENYTVGKMCIILLTSMIDVQQSEGWYPGAPSYVAFHLADRVAADRWWKRHAKLDLHDLQVEAVTWYLDRKHDRRRAEEWGWNVAKIEKHLAAVRKLKDALESTNEPMVISRSQGRL